MFYFKKSVITVSSFTRTYLKSVCVCIYIYTHISYVLLFYPKFLKRFCFFLLSENIPGSCKGLWLIN